MKKALLKIVKWTAIGVLSLVALFFFAMAQRLR
jgi:hypothetical protein